MLKTIIVTGLFFSLFVGLAGCQTNPKVEAVPETKTDEVVDTYYGVNVKDPYRWLENTKSEEVQTWSAKQTARTRTYLDQTPNYKKYLKGLNKIFSAKGISYFALKPLEEGFLAMKSEPLVNQPILIYLKSIDKLDDFKVILDPNTLDKTGATTITRFTPSPSGKYVAIVLSSSGKETGDISIYNLESGEKLKDKVTRAHGPTAGGSMVWLSDEEFIYTRYPHVGEKPKKNMFFYQKLYRHKIGKEKNSYELGKSLNKISAIKLSKAPDRKEVLATVQYGDSGRFSYYLRSSKGKWKKIISEKREIKGAHFGYKGNLFLVSFKDAPKGKLLKVNLKKPYVKYAKLVVPEQKDTLIASFYSGGTGLILKNHVVLTYQLGGPSEIRLFDYEGVQVSLPQTEEILSVGSLKKGEKGFYYSRSSFLEPYSYYHFNLESLASTKTQIGQYKSVDFKGVKVVRDFAVSKDGTKVPVNIILPKGYKAGQKRPLILTGYGGYGINITPRFQASNSLWLNKGGIYAIANIRGGGEYGKTWHDEGRLTKKQNVFDDFYAVSQHLVKENYTSTDQLGIMGGSNGGLLMGAVLTQHPESFKAVVGMVGIYDSLRSELSPNGAFNIPEFGTVKKKDEFTALYAYSPYHSVRTSKYPATLITTGINDNRVDPMHSLKMAALLQKKNQSEEPILLRVDLNTGHGQGDPVDLRVKKMADIFTFFDYQLR